MSMNQLVPMISGHLLSNHATTTMQMQLPPHDHHIFTTTSLIPQATATPFAP